jgi:hypothetical protein
MYSHLQFIYKLKHVYREMELFNIILTQVKEES